MLIAGVVLIVIAAMAFFAAAYTLSGMVSHMRTITLGPGGRVMVGTVSSGGLLVVVYTDSIGKPLETYTTVLGILKSSTYSGMYAVAYTVLSGTGTLYLMNNYSTPITVKYGLVSSTIASLIISDLVVLMAIILGVIGIILVILGAVLKPKR